MITTNAQTEGVPSFWKKSWNAADDKTIKNVGSAQLDNDRDDFTTGSSNHTFSGAAPRRNVPVFTWLDRRFDRPCTIPSALNEI
jgi:hypothetical protein